MNNITYRLILIIVFASLNISYTKAQSTPIQEKYALDHFVNITHIIDDPTRIYNWIYFLEDGVVYFSNNYYYGTGEKIVYSYNLLEMKLDSIICDMSNLSVMQFGSMCYNKGRLIFLSLEGLILFANNKEEKKYYQERIIPYKSNDIKWADKVFLDGDQLILARWKRPRGMEGQMEVYQYSFSTNKWSSVFLFPKNEGGAISEFYPVYQYIDVKDNYVVMSEVYNYKIYVKNIKTGNVDTIAREMEMWDSGHAEIMEKAYRSYRVKNSYKNLDKMTNYELTFLDHSHSVKMPDTNTIFIEYEVKDSGDFNNYMDVWKYRNSKWELANSFDCSIVNINDTALCTKDNYGYFYVYNKFWLLDRGHIIYPQIFYNKEVVDAPMSAIRRYIGNTSEQQPKCYLLIFKTK